MTKMIYPFKDKDKVIDIWLKVQTSPILISLPFKGKVCYINYMQDAAP